MWVRADGIVECIQIRVTILNKLYFYFIFIHFFCGSPDLRACVFIPFWLRPSWKIGYRDGDVTDESMICMGFGGYGVYFK